MHKFISKYGTAAHLALLAVAPLVIFPFFTATTVAVVLLWLSLLAIMWVLMEPSRRADEMLHDARSRVASSVIKDPLFWCFLVLIVFAYVRYLNSGIAMAYDPERSSWYISEPTLKYMSASVGEAGFLPFTIVVALTVLSIGLRHALGKGARISYLMSGSFFAGVAAIIAAVLAISGHKCALSATTCSTLTSSYSGSAFGLYLLAAIVAAAGALEIGWHGVTALSIIAIGGTAIGLWYFAPAPVLLIYVVAALIVLLVSVAQLALKNSSIHAIKLVAVTIIGLLIPLLFIFIALPEGLNESRLEAFGGVNNMFSADFVKARELLCGIAAKVWRENLWTGTGIGSFSLDIRFNLRPSDWYTIKSTQACALNGWWTFMAERGAIGCMSIAVVLGLLLFTLVQRIAASSMKNLFIPFVALAMVATAALAVESLFDISFLRSESLMAIFSFISLSAWAFPLNKSK